MVEKRQAAIVCDIAADERFGQAASLRLSGVRSLIAAPLYDEGGPLGMISLDSRAFVRPFTEEDLELLTSLAAVASLRIRNVQLAHEAAERKRLEEELALARSIQIGLLPKSLPAPVGWSLRASSVPSRWIPPSNTIPAGSISKAAGASSKPARPTSTSMPWPGACAPNKSG